MKIRKKSNQSAAITGIGFLLVVVGFSLASFKLHDMHSKIQVQKEILDERIQEIEEKDILIAYKERKLESKSKILSSLMNEINEMGDSTIQVHCRYDQITDDYRNDKYQNFEWTFWITSSVHRMNQIEKVYFTADAANIINKNKASVECSNGFLVRYTHFDCIESVKVIIQYKGGDKETIYYNTCEDFKDFRIIKKEESNKTKPLKVLL